VCFEILVDSCALIRAFILSRWHHRDTSDVIATVHIIVVFFNFF
jgi:hypothetical protein